MKPAINTAYHVPYGAGYNKRGDTIYIDSRIPKYMTTKKGTRVNVYHYLILHELIEEQLEHYLAYKYQEAHALATRAERAAVEQDGYVRWAEYQKWMGGHLERCRAQFDQIPPDLDLEPYEDSEDNEVLARVHRLMRGK